MRSALHIVNMWTLRHSKHSGPSTHLQTFQHVKHRKQFEISDLTCLELSTFQKGGLECGTVETV